MLLSICIPTYNGAKYIEKNINTIIEQIKKYDFNNVEIVVSDNCSTDDIPKILNEYVKKYPKIITYSRNNENLGYDKNVVKCCELAKGKFIHLFGDDDYYAPLGLKKLHDVLIEHSDLSLLLLSNYYLRNDHYGEIVSRKNLNDKYTFKDNIYVNNSDNFIIDIEDRAWPNTNLVFQKEYFFNIPNLEQFYKKDWIHLYVLLYIAKKYQNCYFFADKYPIVINRVGVQTWLNNNDGPRIYFNNLWTYSFANKLGYNKKVFEWYRKKLLSEYIKNITFRRSNSFVENLRYINKYFYYWKDLPSFYFLFIPKFLNILQTIFSIKNERFKEKKYKILTIFGKRYCIKEKNINKIQLPLNHKNYYIEKISSQGAFKQFMNGCVYEDIYNVYSDYFNKKQYKTRRNKKYLKYLFRIKNKKIVSYGRYLGDFLYCQKLLKENK